jgi:hypothetical protein
MREREWFLALEFEQKSNGNLRAKFGKREWVKMSMIEEHHSQALFNGQGHPNGYVKLLLGALSKLLLQKFSK